SARDRGHLRRGHESAEAREKPCVGRVVTPLQLDRAAVGARRAYASVGGAALVAESTDLGHEHRGCAQRLTRGLRRERVVEHPEVVLFVRALAALVAEAV